MRTKTRYREIKPENNTPVENKSPVEANVIAPPEARKPGQNPENGQVSNPAVQTEPPAISEADASVALKRQLEKQQQAELAQRRRMMAMQSPELMRAARLEEWKPNLSEVELEHLKRNPDWVDYPQITNLAATEALQMHERNSEPYFTAVRERFDAHMNTLRNAQPQPAQAIQQPTPKFFEPPPPPAPPTRSHLISAPVSRQAAGSRDADLNPGRVILTAEENEIARAAGITSTQYAKNKIRLQQEKARGERQ